MAMKKLIAPTAVLATLSLSLFGITPATSFEQTVDNEKLEEIVSSQTLNEAPLENQYELPKGQNRSIELDSSDVSVNVDVDSSALQTNIFVREDGKQIVTQSNKSELLSFSYEFPGSYLREVEGYILVSSEYYGEPELIIDPAWSVDEMGNNIETHYEINGDTLVQVVDARNAVGTVVSDPYIRDAYTRGGHKMGQDLVFTQKDLIGMTTGAGACQLINRIPGPWKKACGAVAVIAGDAMIRNKCVALRMIGFDYGPNIPFALYVEC